MEADAGVEEPFPVLSYVVVFTKCFKKMHCVSLVHVFNSKVVNNYGEHYWPPLVAIDAWRFGVLGASVLGDAGL